MKNVNDLKCPLCGATLKVTDEYLDEEDGNTYYLDCLNCGFGLEVREPEKVELSDFPFYEEGEPIGDRLTGTDHNNCHCINCGHEIHVVGNNMLSDLDDEVEFDGPDDKMDFEFMQCEYCGFWETRWDTSETDRKKFPYWKEGEKK